MVEPYRLKLKHALARVRASERQQVVGEFGEPRDLFEARLKHSLVLFRRAFASERDFNVAAKNRERRFEFVRSISRKLSLALEGLLQLANHLVERSGQSPYLIFRASLFHALVEVAAPYALGCAR